MEPTGWQGPVAVLGAGAMGRGIAYSAAIAGATVRLLDTDPGQLSAAVAQIHRDLEDGVRRGKVTRQAAAAARDQLLATGDLSAALQDATVVIEAVVESLTVKQQLLADAQAAAAAGALIATNTSALSVTEIMATLPDPSRGVGMHFFNPVPKMRLCELVRGLQTSAATFDEAEAVARRMGKETIRVEDAPGFATSRLNAILGNEALQMVESGVATPEDIDTGARLALNHPMGPLEMLDLVGLDVRLAVLEHLESRLGPRFRPTNLHRNLLAAGRLGRKSGQGIYRYDADGRRIDEPSDVGRRPH